MSHCVCEACEIRRRWREETASNGGARNIPQEERWALHSQACVLDRPKPALTLIQGGLSEDIKP